MLIAIFVREIMTPLKSATYPIPDEVRTSIGLSTGPHVLKILAKYPKLNLRLTEQKFYIYNKNYKQGLIIFCGKDKKNVTYFKKSSTFKSLTDNLKQVCILVNLPKHAHIPELSSAYIEDLCLAEGIISINIIGISYGGYCALELIADIKKNSVPIKVKKLVHIVAPVCLKDLRPHIRTLIIIPRLIGRLLRWKTQKFSMRNFDHKFELARSIGREEIHSNISVLSVRTGGFDPFIKKKHLSTKLNLLFNKIEVLELRGEPFFRTYSKSLLKKFNFQGAHGIYHEDLGTLRDRLLLFLN